MWRAGGRACLHPCAKAVGAAGWHKCGKQPVACQRTGASACTAAGPPTTPALPSRPPRRSHAIVSSAMGPEYYVTIMSFVDKTQLEPGCSVLLHNKVWKGAGQARGGCAGQQCSDALCCDAGGPARLRREEGLLREPLQSRVRPRRAGQG